MGNTVSNEAALLTTEHQATELVGLEASTSGETHEEEPWESFLHRPFTQVLMLDEVPSTAADEEQYNVGQYTPPEGADFSAEACPLPLGEQQPADAHTRTALLDPAKLDAVRHGRYDATPALRCLSGTDAKASGRLFLFHYATGDAQSLMHMTAKLPPHVAEVWAFEYPAHGARECTQTSDDEPSTMPSVAELVEEQVAAIAPLMMDKDKPCVFYGHSFGSHVAFALAQRLWALGLPLPCLLIASGRFAPHVTSPLRDGMDVLATRAVVEQRMRSWGSTAETLGAAEYASKVEVLVQCTLALDMPCAPTSLPLSICVYWGEGYGEGEGDAAAVRQWAQLSSIGSFRLRELAGGHAVYLQRNASHPLGEAVRESLREDVERAIGNACALAQQSRLDVDV